MFPVPFSLPAKNGVAFGQHGHENWSLNWAKPLNLNSKKNLGRASRFSSQRSRLFGVRSSSTRVDAWFKSVTRRCRSRLAGAATEHGRRGPASAMPTSALKLGCCARSTSSGESRNQPQPLLSLPRLIVGYTGHARAGMLDRPGTRNPKTRKPSGINLLGFCFVTRRYLSDQTGPLWHFR